MKRCHKLEDCNVETRHREKPQITEMLNRYMYVKQTQDPCRDKASN
jgi:hypothetical protein